MEEVISWALILCRIGIRNSVHMKGSNIVTESYIQASGALFELVQLSHIFPDSKTFPDCTHKVDPETIRQHFKVLLNQFVDDSLGKPFVFMQADQQDTLLQLLRQFVDQHFEMPQVLGRSVAQVASMVEHIDNLWEALQRSPTQNVSPFSTLIPLPYPYIVPGGRFGEIFYWDSYFTMLGLVAAKRVDLVENMIRNFSHLIDQYGHIPNGNRVYFVSRSQAPFFCAMLQLLERERGFEAVRPYLAQLEKECRFWMDGAAPAQLGKTTANRRTVTLEDGTVLNRYWDDKNAPREEAFQEDAMLFLRAPADRQADMYRNLRAAAESGFDFSVRWFDQNHQLASIRTIDIIPVDLNSLLYNMEKQLAVWLDQAQEPRAAMYAHAAEQRKAAILKYCWNDRQGYFFDYSWKAQAKTNVWSLAGVYPLFCRVADEAQAARVAEQIERQFLKPGGVVTTLIQTGEQWDYPNGWAPLQAVTVLGLLNYNHRDLAKEIARRFVDLAEQIYQRTGKMMEKYDVCDLNREAGGGEYPGQDGFGWTNGVVQAFIKLFSLR